MKRKHVFLIVAILLIAAILSGCTVIEKLEDLNREIESSRTKSSIEYDFQEYNPDGSASSEETEQSDPKLDGPSETAGSSKKYHYLGEKVEMSGADNPARAFTIVFTGCDEYRNDSGHRYVGAKYEVENIGSESILAGNLMFDIYVDGYAVDSYWDSSVSEFGDYHVSENISPGRSLRSILYIDVSMENIASVEIEHGNAVFLLQRQESLSSQPVQAGTGGASYSDPPASTSKYLCYGDAVVGRLLGRSLSDLPEIMGGQPLSGTSVDGSLYEGGEYSEYDGITFIEDWQTGKIAWIYIRTDKAEINGTTLEKRQDELIDLLGAPEINEPLHMVYKLYDDIYDITLSLEIYFPVYAGSAASNALVTLYNDSDMTANSGPETPSYAQEILAGWLWLHQDVSEGGTLKYDFENTERNWYEFGLYFWVGDEITHGIYFAVNKTDGAIFATYDRDEEYLPVEEWYAYY